MGTKVRAFTRRNIIAVAVGVLLAGLPVLAFEHWLDGLIDRQGQEEVDTSARRAIALAETRVTQVIEALDDLAARGVDSCAPAQINAMRMAAFATIPVKEIAVLGPNGETLCTDLGLSMGERALLSSEPLAGADDYWIDVLRLAGGEHAVRLRRKVGGNAVAALVPAVLFLPQVSSRGNPFSAYAHIATAKGAVIGEVGSRDPSDAAIGADAISERFGFHVAIAISRARVRATHADIERIGMFATGALALILIAFGALLPKRSPDNPVAEIERALAAGEFVPYYQPIVDIRSGKLRGAEVLVRWKKPDGTLVLPGAFIPLAESSGLIRAMTRDLMRRVCVGGGCRDRRAAGAEGVVQFCRPIVFRRQHRAGRARHFRRLADQSVAGGARVDRARPDREPDRDAADHRRLAGAGRAHRHRRRRHRPQRAVLHAQARRRHHQDRQDVRRRHRHRPQLHHHRRNAGRRSRTICAWTSWPRASRLSSR